MKKWHHESGYDTFISPKAWTEQYHWTQHNEACRHSETRELSYRSSSPKLMLTLPIRKNCFRFTSRPTQPEHVATNRKSAFQYCNVPSIQYKCSRAHWQKVLLHRIFLSGQTVEKVNRQNFKNMFVRIPKYTFWMLHGAKKQPVEVSWKLDSSWTHGAQSKRRNIQPTWMV